MEILHILMPSRDGRVNLKTVLLGLNVARLMGKDSISWHVITGAWLTAARRLTLLDALAEEERINGKKPDKLRALIISDDIQILNNPQEIADIFLDCDRNGRNIVANYKSSNGTNLIFNGDHRYTDDELRALTDPYVPLNGDCGAIDFYYGEVPINYQWHMDVVDEATSFFRDNKQLNVQLATKVHLAHRVSWIRSTWQDFDVVTDINEVH